MGGLYTDDECFLPGFVPLLLLQSSTIIKNNLQLVSPVFFNTSDVFILQFIFGFYSLVFQLILCEVLMQAQACLRQLSTSLCLEYLLCSAKLNPNYSGGIFSFYAFWKFCVYRGRILCIWMVKIKKMKPLAFKLVPWEFFETLGILTKICKSCSWTLLGRHN